VLLSGALARNIDSAFSAMLRRPCSSHQWALFNQLTSYAWRRRRLTHPPLESQFVKAFDSSLLLAAHTGLDPASLARIRADCQMSSRPPNAFESVAYRGVIRWD
jgi:hypothetical protein